LSRNQPRRPFNKPGAARFPASSSRTPSPGTWRRRWPSTTAMSTARRSCARMNRSWRSPGFAGRRTTTPSRPSPAGLRPATSPPSGARWRIRRCSAGLRVTGRLPVLK